MYIAAATFGAYCSNLTEKPGYCKREIIKSVILGCATLTGLVGASLLWTGQFLYLSNYGPNKGLYNSMFFTVQQFTGVAAQTFNYIYYTFSPDVKSYFMIFLVVGVLGCLSFTLLPKVNEITEDELKSESSSSTEENETLNQFNESGSEGQEKSLQSKKSQNAINAPQPNSVKKSI